MLNVGVVGDVWCWGPVCWSSEALLLCWLMRLKVALWCLSVQDPIKVWIDVKGGAGASGLSAGN